MLYRCIVVCTLLVGIPLIGAQESATAPTFKSLTKHNCFYREKDDGLSRVEATFYYGGMNRYTYTARCYSYTSKSYTPILDAQAMYETLGSEHSAQIGSKLSSFISPKYILGRITSKSTSTGSSESLLITLRDTLDGKWASPNATYSGDPLEHTCWQRIGNVILVDQQSSIERKGKALLGLVAQNSQLSAKILVAPMD